MKNKVLFILPFIFLLSMCFTYAFQNNSLVAYYSFDTISNHTLLDISGNNNTLATSGGYTLVNGIINNGLIDSDSFFQSANMNINGSFTINFWVNVSHYNYGGCILNIYSVNSSGSKYQCIDFDSFYSKVGYHGFINNPLRDQYDYYSYVIPKTWNMITLTYNKTSSNISFYINNILQFSGYTNDTTFGNITLNLPTFVYFVPRIMDELSIWNTTLDYSEGEIAQLYNFGLGLSFTDTNNTEYSSQNYTYNNALPQEYTSEYIDICIPSINFNPSGILCHHLYYNSSVGAYCPIVNQVYCDVGCSDNTSYWDSINSDPIDMNYSGHCSLVYHGVPLCDVVGQVRCNGSYKVQTCTKNAFDVNEWLDTNTCINGFTCSSGSCVNATTNPNFEFIQNDIDMWNGFFGIDSHNSSGRVLISIIAIMLSGIIIGLFLLAFSYLGGQNLPFNMGLIIVVAIMGIVFAYFIGNGFIPIWALLLIIVLVAFALSGKAIKHIFGR